MDCTRQGEWKGPYRIVPDRSRIPTPLFAHVCPACYDVEYCIKERPAMCSFPIVPVVLAGGSGTRLWPLSRSLFPKQFLSLINDQSMLQDTLARLDGADHIAAPIVICNDDHRFIVAEQLRQQGISDVSIMLEPIGRNTAPAIAIAALHAVQAGDDPLLLVLAADHDIQDSKAFHAALRIAADTAAQGALVTFGIQPTAPETGYGYLRAAPGSIGVARKLESFVEKPDIETAQSYLASGDYFWNSGMFMFRASVYLQQLDCFAPEMLAACQQALELATTDFDFIRLDATAFSASPDNSIDYAVMEKTDKAMVVPLDAGWNDIGSWSALWEVADKDAAGNVQHGDVISIDNNNCYLQGAENRLIAAVGLHDLIIVDTDDAILVVDKHQVQHVKTVVEILKKQDRPEARQHRSVYRPWGSYHAIDHGQRYQVKRITVNPGCKLSVQMHHHRAEHWIVVSGTAKVRNGDQEMLLTENQSVYIPLGTIHALENPGKIPLELIEVQTGAYLGEDDIIRLEDLYGRS
jgi:mannose-1-phosphate guanylyltransferase/mannose-6-phosphate isomerase